MSEQDKKEDQMADVEQKSVYHMMRRLQEHVRSNIPAMISQRAMTSFTLNEDETPQEAQQNILVVVYPQDPFVGQPEVRRMSVQDIRPGLINARIKVEDSRGASAMPDDEGNYMYWPGTIEFDQVNAFYYTTFTLRMYERYTRRVIPWAFPAQRLIINPHVGTAANAFYDEGNQLLGFYTFNSDGREMSTAQSADIVSHEAAHAVLDGIRDLYNESFGLGARAFHESFGDISAMLVALHDDSLIRRLLKWTDGDLRMSTFVSEVAERLVELNQSGGDYIPEHTLYLRNAFNRFEFKPFDELPFSSSNHLELSRQEHSYSRLFTGAFYDILVGIYESLLDTMPPYIAIYRARDMMGHLLMNAIEAGPIGEVDFADVARAFLSVDDVLNNQRHCDIIKRVFDQRKILSVAEADAHLKSLETIPDILLPKTINTWLASAQFLEEVIIPSLKLENAQELTPVATYRNNDGNVFMSYFCSQSLRLRGAEYGQFDGVKVDVFGGLTLMFDASDRLRSICYRLVNEEDLRQIRLLTSEMIQAGAIVDQLHMLEDEPVIQRLPQGLFVLNSAPGKLRDSEYKLVKYPVIFDRIPDNPTGFKDYLQKWSDQLDEDESQANSE